VKPNELEGVALDAAVAAADGVSVQEVLVRRLGADGAPAEPFGGALFRLDDLGRRCGFYEPSTSWAQGGPIIERERIDISSPDPFDEDQRWHALMWLGRDAATVSGKFSARGETPIIAAMRAFVASKS
jgi:hypothetical protein